MENTENTFGWVSLIILYSLGFMRVKLKVIEPEVNLSNDKAYGKNIISKQITYILQKLISL